MAATLRAQRNRGLRGLGVSAGLFVAFMLPFSAGAQLLTIFAAASLKDALDEAIEAWPNSERGKVRAVYASSAALARQIEHGAPADVYISADRAWMDYLLQRSLVARDSVSVVAGNRLALVAASGSKIKLEIAPGFPLERALAGARLAIANAENVPAGRYAREALENLGVWSRIRERVAQADNVRGALNFIARGESPLGIVYRSDAHAERRVRVVALFSAHLHKPIQYPGAIRSGAVEPRRGQALLTFLRSQAGQAVFAAHGFEPAP